jgi:thimet oligopeptidase
MKIFLNPWYTFPNMKRKEYTKNDFSWVKWSPQKIGEVADLCIRETNKACNEVKNTSKPYTFENTVLALENAYHIHASDMGYINALRYMSSHEDVRAAASKALEKVDKAFIKISYDKKLFSVIREFSETKTMLDADQKRLLDDYMSGYTRRGMFLQEATQKKLEAISKKLSTLGLQFSKNISDHHDHILVTKDELDGLSDYYIQNLKKDPKTKKYIVSLDYPELFPFLQYANNAQKRAELAQKFLQKGGKKNLAILNKMVALRKEKAALLGYASYPDYTTELRTAKNAARVKSFLNASLKDLKGAAHADVDVLIEMRNSELNTSLEAMPYSDIAYYLRLHKRNVSGINSDELREYFPLEQVKKGMFSVYGALFSIRITRNTTIPLWHKDAELYEVRNKKGGLIAYFALDLFPRPGKYGHACADNIIAGREVVVDGCTEYATPLSYMITNFPRSSKKSPSLLSHGEVETFFHEFGHVVHSILTTARYPSQSGFNVAWDYVEAPSQMLEYWAWQPQVLDKISSHYKTGQKMPKKLRDTLIAQRHTMEAYSATRQFVLSLTDITLHDQDVSDPNLLYKKYTEEFTKVVLPEGHNFFAGFGHMVGYDAGYYSYMWSRVFAADMFTRFEKEGILNPTTGNDYKTWILEKGSSMDELELIEKFLRRKPNNEAFLKELGIKK